MLVDEGVAYAQSNAILLHVATKFGRLGGETPARLAQVRERLFWEANRIGISLPNLRHYQRFAPNAAPEGALDWLRARMNADLKSLDDELADQAFLLGADITVADISCAAYLLYEDAGLDLAQWPAVHAWMQRIRARPGFVAADVLLLKPEGP